MITGTVVRPRTEVVDPVTCADHAEAILREAWQPPCMCYPSDYLRWQFQFPGNPPALAAVAIVGEERIGFNAVIPRRLRGRGWPVEVHLLSFVSVLPSYRGMGVGAALYQTLLRAIRDQHRPVVAFAEPASAGEKLLIGCLEATGYRHCSLGHYQTGAYLRQPRQVTTEVSVEEVTDLREFLRVIEQCGGSGILWNAPDLQQLEHYSNDPRGRVLVLARRAAGQAIGAAMLVLSRATTRRGPEQVVMVDSLFLPEPSAEVLKAILEHAGGRWREQVTSPVITVPNLHGLDPALARSVGLRATPSRFTGHLFAPADSPMFSAHGTTLEIV
jgi:GNAT superfamily N-acetyltransferase